MHPILFQIGPFKVFSYGVMLMIGFVAAVAWSVKEGRRRGISSDQILDAALAVLIGGLIGARTLFILLDPKDFHHPLDWFRTWQGGLSFHGCLVGGALAMVWVWKRKGVPLIPLMDTAAPGVALGYAFGRVGCFLNGCCYGHACDLPWATRFHDSAYPGGWTPPMHPAQLYSSAAGLLMFGVLAWMSRRQRYDGQLALSFFILYSVYRFLVEFVRAGVTADVAWDGLTQAQIASILIALVATLLMPVARNYAKRKGVGATTSMPHSAGVR